MVRKFLISAALCLAAMPAQSALAQTAQPPAPARDGQRDFDWEIGTWTTKVRVLRNPLSGEPPEWAEYQGTSVIKPLMDGRWNFVELSVSGAAGKIEGGSPRLYNPESRQWSLNYIGLRNGLLTAPIHGGFDSSGHGTFYGQDMMEGRAILVRFVIVPKSVREASFEQAYSADGGKTWEDNWIAVDKRR